MFREQNQFFKGVAKSIGDSRVDKVFDGKLLRKVEVVRAGTLS
jgi:hypothetical protein